VRVLLIGLAAGIALAVFVYAATGGSVLVLPLVLVPALTFFSFGRRRR
jgi:hypothetical protein